MITIKDIFPIVLLTMLSIPIIIFIGAFFLKMRMKNGGLKPIALIEMSSIVVLNILRKKYGFMLCTIQSLKLLDDYIEEILQKEDKAKVLDNNELLFQLGSYLGQVLKYRKKYKWKIDNNDVYMEKKGSVINPHDKVRKRICNGKEDSLYEYAILV
ncbi:hypothetical protein [Treponema pedis]|uniref:hypothetical protein n=1 Tax=Treponema pedis TaxID=409322 RepID=UPI0004664FB8|nr:hypothetical protein [Treponema pedis]QSI03985.1 hypothetical protein DYQ05_03130 [Treponema pedis]